MSPPPTLTNPQEKQDLHKPQSTSPIPTNRDSLPSFNRLLTSLHDHIDDEANEETSRLENLLEKEKSQQLANQFQRTKMIRPTQSHPSALNKAYFESLALMWVVPID